MVVIGLTGNIGAGKSHVIGWLKGRGALAIDADQVAREAIEPGMPACAQIVAHFGPGVLRDDGAVDRAALGAIVFAERARLAELEAIVHPEVFRLTMAKLQASSAPVAAIEAIKLIESGRILAICDELWVVIADEEVLLDRLMRDRGMSAEEARRRLAAQMPQAEMVQRATRVIENNGSVEDLENLLTVIWADFLAKYEIAPSDVNAG